MDLYVHNMVQCTLYMARTYRFIWQYGKFLPTWHNLATKLSWFMQASCSYYQLKKIKTYEILELSNNMTFILHLMKIRQLVQKFKCTHTHTVWWALYLLILDPIKRFCYSLSQFTRHLMIQPFESDFYFAIFYFWGREVITRILILYVHRYKIILSYSIQYVGKHLHRVFDFCAWLYSNPIFQAIS